MDDSISTTIEARKAAARAVMDNNRKEINKRPVSYSIYLRAIDGATLDRIVAALATIATPERIGISVE